MSWSVLVAPMSTLVTAGRAGARRFDLGDARAVCVGDGAHALDQLEAEFLVERQKVEAGNAIVRIGKGLAGYLPLRNPEASGLQTVSPSRIAASSG